MDMFKKKSFKWCNENVSRDFRHVETLKARESSRFERLSMLRDISNSDFEMEIKKNPEVQVEEPQQSRLDMLRKWKQEKLLKKELEAKQKKKPFYAGSSRTNEPVLKTTPHQVFPKFASSKQPSTTFNASKIVKTKFTDPKSSLQFNKARNITKQIPTQNVTTPKVGKIPTPNVKQSIAAPPKFQKVLNPNTKESGVRPKFQKSATPNTKQSVIAPPKLQIPAQNIKQNVIVPKVKKIPTPCAKQTIVAPPKFQKIPTQIDKQNSVVPKFKKIPTPNTKQSVEIHAKLQKEISVLPTKNVPSRIGYCFKKAATDAKKTKTGYNNALIEKPDKKCEEIRVESTKKKSFVEHSNQSFENSLINSFAPNKFEFKPPEGLQDFMFEDDDPYEALENIKAKFMFRTSTPTKASESSSSLKHVHSPFEESSVKEKDVPEKYPCKESSVDEEDVPEKYPCKESSVDEKDLSEKSPCDSSIDKMNLPEKLPADSSQCSPENLYNVSVSVNGVDENLQVSNCEVFGNTSTEQTSNCCESPFDILDLSKMKEDFEEIELVKLEDEKIKTIDIPEESRLKLERKSAVGAHKRFSMLKSMSTLNAIAEDEDFATQSSEKISKEKQYCPTPKPSKRLSTTSCQNLSNLKEIVEEENILGSVTPRRSLRLLKKQLMESEGECSNTVSPFKQWKQKPRIEPRRSMRLIDLNTPEKDINQGKWSKTNLTADFEKLNLQDSKDVDCDAFLIDLENTPGVSSKSKSRKVSLLYSPEKNRNVLRKSIKGDLMSFSPN